MTCAVSFPAIGNSGCRRYKVVLRPKEMKFLGGNRKWVGLIGGGSVIYRGAMLVVVGAKRYRPSISEAQNCHYR